MTGCSTRQLAGIEGVASIDAVLASALLPSPPKVAMRLLALCADPTVGVGEITAVIETDPSMATRMIRLANTVQFGAGISVTNIQAAAVRLGTDKIKSVALAFEIADVASRNGSDTFDFETYWQGCVMRGCIARAMAMNFHSRIAGEAFLVGLLQDIGMPVLAKYGGPAYAALIEQAGGCQLRLATLESQAFGFNHIHVVARMFQRWNMPAILAGAIGRHHVRPPMRHATDPSLRLWQIAYVVGLMPIGKHREPTFYDSCLCDVLSETFGIEDASVGNVLRQARMEFHDIEDMFRPYIGREVDAGALLAQASALLGSTVGKHPARDEDKAIRPNGVVDRLRGTRSRIGDPAIPLGI